MDSTEFANKYPKFLKEIRSVIKPELFSIVELRQKVNEFYKNIVTQNDLSCGEN